MCYYRNMHTCYILTAKALDSWFDCHVIRIRRTLSFHNPTKTTCPRSKPCWSRLLSSLGKEHHRRTRAHKRHPDPSTSAQIWAARTAYFKEVRRAKNKY